MVTTSHQLFGCGNHFTDILLTSGEDGTPQHQIINAFTTFLLLSLSKISFVSITLLLPSTIHYIYGDNPKCAMYCESTVECHTLEYSMFAAIAVF